MRNAVLAVALVPVGPCASCSRATGPTAPAMNSLLAARGVADPLVGITYADAQVRVVIFVAGCQWAVANPDAVSGEVLFADFSCRGTVSHRCVGPGVFGY